MENSTLLTKYPTGSFRELASISFSLIMMLVSTSLMGFVDRMILARHSLESLEACASAISLNAIFQMFCVRIAYTTQIFISQHQGANRPDLMGKCIWQAIWFSLFSMGVTLPFSWIMSLWFFEGTLVAHTGASYFYVLMCFNFLFPLGGALASFYAGRGKIKTVLVTTFVSQIFNILLDFVLIFGVNGFLPAQGALGGAWAMVISQLGFCIFLFADFLKSKNRQTFGTDQWRFCFREFSHALKIGIPRAISSLVLLGAWAASSRIMMQKGGDYIAVMAFGSSLLLIMNSLTNGLTQGVMTAGAYVIGAKSWPLLWKIYKSGSLLALLLAILLSIPLIFFPDITIGAFFKEDVSLSLMNVLRSSCIALWVMFMIQGISAVGNGMLMASGDTIFHMLFHMTFGWMVSYFPVYFCIGQLGWSPNTFFLCTALFCLVNTVVYYLRLSQEKWKIALISQ